MEEFEDNHLLQRLRGPRELEVSNANAQLDEVLTHAVGFGKFQWMLLLLCGMGYFAVCSELLLLVFLLQPLQHDSSFNDNQGSPLSYERFAWLPFCTTLSSLVSGLLWSHISDSGSSSSTSSRFSFKALQGRQRPFIITCFLTGIFGLSCAFAENFTELVILRSLASVGLGGISTIDFVLFAEFCPSHNRGPWMVSITLFGALGVLFVAGMAWLVIPSVLGWRYFVAICSIPTLIVFILRIFISEESPYFLVKHQRFQEAHTVLQKMAKVNGKEYLPASVFNPEDASLDDFREATEQKEPTFLRGWLLLTEGRWRVTLPLWGIWFCLATGYWGVTIFLPSYFVEIGLNPYETFFMMVAAEIPSLVLTMYLIHRQQKGSSSSGLSNRVNCMIFYSLSTCLMLISFVFVKNNTALVVFSMLLYAAMIPIWALVNTFTPEAYPTHLRSTGVAFANLAAAIPGLVTTFSSGAILSSTKLWLYPTIWSVIFFMCFCFSLLLRFSMRRASKNDLTSSSTRPLSTLGDKTIDTALVLM